MEKCKFCGAELEENSSVCPDCGKDNALQTDAPAEETVTAPEAESASAEAQDAPAEEQKEPAQSGVLLTPGTLAVIVGVFLLLVAVIVGLVVSGRKSEPEETQAPTEQTQTVTGEQAEEQTGEQTEATEAPTVPADGNPEDVTCKGSYTASDEEVKAAAQTVIARLGDSELTNEDVQVLYWSEVWQFLSQYGSYAAYFGLDPTQSLDTQMSTIVEGWTWQQVFLDNALKRWQECRSLAMEAENEGFELDAEARESMDTTLDQLDALAAQNGMKNGTELLTGRMGAGATPEAYLRFQKNQYIGYGYFSDVYAGMKVDDVVAEEYFNEHAQEYEQQGLTKDTCTVDVRHILIYPEGATSDTVRTEEFSQEAWDAGEAEAQRILDLWLAGEKTEESFAALAQEYSGDPGSQANGGLYEGVGQGEMVEEFDAWCFDPQRQVGDTGIVKTAFGYHVMYFCGSQTLWLEIAREDVLSAMANQFVEDVMANYTLDVDYSGIVLANVVIE